MSETTRTPFFSRYEILEQLGEGGFGTVYKARHKILGRLVALKVLPPALRQEAESMERFKREAAALAQLDHPHVVRVYDADVEQSFPYLAMELVDGEDLRHALDARGRLPMAAVVRLGLELAEALDHVHRQDIVHRDVKPSNVIIDPDGAARLTDFGIAFAATLPRISRGMLGTPEYMSPEQVEGRRVDGRSDLYSLGMTLYECLTGGVPFRREGDSLTALNALVRRILKEPVPPVRTRRPDTPAWLAEAVERCLAKQPADRFGDGAALAAVLRAGLGSAAVPAHPRQRAPRSAPPTLVHDGRRRSKAGWAALLAGILLLGGAGYGYSAGWFSGLFDLSFITKNDRRADDASDSSHAGLPLLDSTLIAANDEDEADDVASLPDSVPAGVDATEPDPSILPKKEKPPEAPASLEDVVARAAAAYRAGRFAEALPLLREAAGRGSPVAQTYLGAMYAGGQGTPQDHVEAVRWYRLAAGQGYAPAQFNLGLMYRQGRGVPQSDREAAAWYRKAAEQGYAPAQFNLGLMYRQGRGVEPSNKEAFAWYLKAAEQGHANAQYNVGRLYWRGEGVPQNDAETIRWYRKAAAQGHERARLALERMTGENQENGN